MKINTENINKFFSNAKIGFAIPILFSFSTMSYAQEHSWISGTAVSPNDPIAQATDYFAERVEELTDGEVVIKTNHGGALGGERDLIETVLQGGIQVVTPGQALLSGWYKPAEIWTFPYLFESVEHKDRVWDSIKQEYGDTVAEEAGLRPVAAVPRGPRMLTANKVVKTPEDMEGLKIRVPETEMWLRTFERFGASPTPLPFPEVYQSLRSGVIDGQDNPASLSYNSGFFEVNTHLNLTEHMMQDNAIVIGETAWQSLSPEQQDAVMQAAEDVEQEFRGRFSESNDDLIEEIRDMGIVISKVDKEAFRKSTEGLEDEFPHIMPWLEKIKSID